MGKYYVVCAGLVLVGCANGSDVPEDVVPSHPPTPQVAPNLPITKVVEVDAGSDGTNTQWAEMCYWQIADHVFARHEFPGKEVGEIATHVRVYEALDIPVEVTVPLASYGEAWYDCGPVGKSTPMIIFNWIK